MSPRACPLQRVRAQRRTVSPNYRCTVGTEKVFRVTRSETTAAAARAENEMHFIRGIAHRNK